MFNDGDEENLLAKALYYQPEDAEGEDTDFSKPPTSAHEYLRRVHREAQQLQDVVVAEIDPEKLTQGGQIYNYETRKKIQTSCSGLLPSKEWQDAQISNFSQLRLNIRLPQKDKLNKKKSEKEWALFCFGSLYWNKLICMDEDRGEFVTEDIKGNSPLLSVLATFKQTHVVDLLEYMVQWTEELNKLDSEQGVWFYSLLALLVKPLHPDVISSLRSLALFCSKKREEEVTFAPELNLFICLVAKYFGQADLSD